MQVDTGKPTATYPVKPAVTRTVFATPRAAEFLELRALQAQTGQPEDAFGQVVPPPDVLTEHVQKVRDTALTDLVAAELERMVDVDAVVEQLLADRAELVVVDEDRVRANFTDHPIRSWRSAVEQLVHEDIDAADGLADAARAQLAEQLAAAMNDDEASGDD